MTARQWVPLLRRLRAAGWERCAYGPDGAIEYVWHRNHNAINQQKISMDSGFAGFSLHGVVLSAVGLTPSESTYILNLLGAFEPAPKPEYPPLTAAQLAARDAILTRAANDPDVSDDVFAILAPVIERREPAEPGSVA